MLDRKLVHYVVAVVLLVSLVPLQTNIDHRRVDEKLVVLREPAIRPGETAIGLLLAGFRGLAANMLWFRATVLFEQGRVTEEIPLFQAISYLQPRFRAMWSFAAWHMAYNVSAYFYDRKDLADEEVDDYRFQCFNIAEEFLRKGIKYNYYHYDLHWDLGFTILYYKQYKLLKEREWPGEQEALHAALEEMRIASLFQPPLARHPAYVGRIMAIIVREGGLLDEAYKMWYRLKTWPQVDENMKLVEKHMTRLIEVMKMEDAKAYALDLESDKKMIDAYKAWYYLLTETKKSQAELAANEFADPKDVEETDKEVRSFTENVGRLAEVLTKQSVDVESLQKSALQEGRPPALQKRMDEHFQSLKKQATEEHNADKEKTMEMYRELTKPAPRLDWWILLFVPLLLLAAGHLIFGKERYAS